MSYYVYILANRASTVLYTGMTNDLIRRVYEHKSKFVDGFTKRYNVDRLVYYEVADSPMQQWNERNRSRAARDERRWT
jgi:putative endonuclease